MGKSNLRGRRSKGKGEGEFEREARSWRWVVGGELGPMIVLRTPTPPVPRSRFKLELPFSLPLLMPATQARKNLVRVAQEAHLIPLSLIIMINLHILLNGSHIFRMI